MPRFLRDYQALSISAVYDEWRAGRTRTSLVKATGLGKTDDIAWISVNEVGQGKRVLITGHRDELLDQLIERCRMWLAELNIKGSVGRVQGQRNEVNRPIVVASVQTVRQADRRQLMRQPDVVITDEAHLAAAPSYRELYEWAGAYDERATRMLGVTATMMRGDNAALGDIWQSVALQRDLLWGIEHGPAGGDGPPVLVESPLGGLMEASAPVQPGGIGWLVRPRGKAVVTGMDLSGVKVGSTTEGGGGKDWQRSELGELVIQDAEQLVQGWIDHAENRLTMMFVPNVASAKAIEEEFKRKSVPAECVTGSTPAEKRRAVKRRMQTGETKVRVDVMVGTTGFDCPEIQCIYLARPTMLLGLLTQMIGRGTRPAAWVGKLDCLVLDAVGSTRHVKLQSLIDLSPSFEYDTSEIDKLPCPECGSEPGEACHEGCECSRCMPTGPARETRRKLIGPTVYEDVELFEEGGLRWLRTNGGLRFLPAGDRFVHLDPESGGTWAVGHCLREGVDRRGAFLAAGLELNLAIKMGEACARQLHPRIETPYKGAGRATPKQVAYLAGWDIDASDYTGKAAAEAIDVQVASACLDRLLAAAG